jgi:hypothetical protein
MLVVILKDVVVAIIAVLLSSFVRDVDKASPIAWMSGQRDGLACKPLALLGSEAVPMR